MNKWSLVVLLALMGCAGNPSAYSGSAHAAATAATPVASVAVVPAAPAAPSLEVYASIPDVAERAVKSVVSVATKAAVRPVSELRGLPPGLFPGFPGMEPNGRQAQGLGSGVIVGAEGLIVTNHHVVEGAESVSVTLHDGRVVEAEVIGDDPKSDVALLRLKEVPAGLEALPWGDTEPLRLGQTVLAVGNPFGVGQTVTMGIVSALGRGDIGLTDYEDFIQTDAAINPGNSGGALVDLNGRLVGMNTAILSRSGGNQGIGFAVPATMVHSAVDQLVKYGEVRRGWLGVAIQEVDGEMAGALGLSDSEGVLIGDVEPGSPAESAGLKRGDVVKRLNGLAVPDVRRFRNAIAQAGPEMPFELDVMREGKAKHLKGSLGIMPGEAVVKASVQGGEPSRGLGLAELTPELRAEVGLPRGIEGVAVAEVRPGSAAAQAGLRAGDVLLEVNRRPVGRVSSVTQALGAGRALLLVLREGRTHYVVLNP